MKSTLMRLLRLCYEPSFPLGFLRVSVFDDSLSSEITYHNAYTDPFPYDDFASTLRTEETKQILHQVEREAIVLLENKDNTLPFATNEVTELAVFGPLAERVNVRRSID